MSVEHNWGKHGFVANAPLKPDPLHKYGGYFWMEKYQQSCLVKINDEAFGIINPEGHWEQVHPDKIALGTNDTGCVYLVQPKTTRKDRTLAEWIDDKNNHHGKYIDGKFVRPWLPGQ